MGKSWSRAEILGEEYVPSGYFESGSTGRWWNVPDVNKVIDRLYIGTLYGVRSLFKENPNQIDVVINVCDEDLWGDRNEYRHLIPEQIGLTYEWYPLRDGRPDNDLDTIRNAVDAVERHMLDGKRVMINCHAGISRSANILCGYLTRIGFEWDEAVKFLQSKRSIVYPNPKVVRSTKIALGLWPYVDGYMDTEPVDTPYSMSFNEDFGFAPSQNETTETIVPVEKPKSESQLKRIIEKKCGKLGCE